MRRVSPRAPAPCLTETCLCIPIPARLPLLPTSFSRTLAWMRGFPPPPPRSAWSVPCPSSSNPISSHPGASNSGHPDSLTFSIPAPSTSTPARPALLPRRGEGKTGFAGCASVGPKCVPAGHVRSAGAGFCRALVRCPGFRLKAPPRQTTAPPLAAFQCLLLSASSIHVGDSPGHRDQERTSCRKSPFYSV